MNCPYGTMDWYCVKLAGHEGPHESLTKTFRIQAPSGFWLDVQACVKQHLPGCECWKAYWLDWREYMAFPLPPTCEAAVKTHGTTHG